MMRTAMIAVVVGLSVGAAHAQQVSAEQALAFLDKDGDGRVSLQEYLGFQVGRMAQFDTNGDGALSEREFHDSLQGDAKKNSARSFKMFNTGENKRALTQREFAGYHAYIFQTFVDANKDGFASADEWAKVMAALQK